MLSAIPSKKARLIFFVQKVQELYSLCRMDVYCLSTQILPRTLFCLKKIPLNMQVALYANYKSDLKGGFIVFIHFLKRRVI